MQKIEQALIAGNATEHTHRPTLKALLEALDLSATATNEPKRIACGAPGGQRCKLPYKAHQAPYGGVGWAIIPLTSNCSRRHRSTFVGAALYTLNQPLV